MPSAGGRCFRGVDLGHKACYHRVDFDAGGGIIYKSWDHIGQGCPACHRDLNHSCDTLSKHQPPSKHKYNIHTMVDQRRRRWADVL